MDIFEILKNTILDNKKESVIVISLILAIIIYVLTNPVNNSARTQEPPTDISTGLRNEMQHNLSTPIDDSKVLNPAIFKEFTILKIKQASYNTKLIRFEIPFSKSLNLPLGRHLSLRADIDGSKVMRAYTPTTKSNQQGYFDLLIKTYDMGKLSPYLHSLKVGSKVEVRGPVGRFNYIKNSYKTIGLIAGGSGITPCLQVLRCILEGGLTGYHDDETKFILFFQNRREADILLKSDLDELATRYAARLQVIYFLSNALEAWQSSSSGSSKQRRGYISANDIKEMMHIEQAQYVCLCGPSGFTTSIKDILIVDGGHTELSIYLW